jgi:hypothetical protein
MFLSPEQLEQLTGRRRPSAQIRWLAAHRWAYAVRADGRPVVSTSEAQRQLESGGARRAPAAVEPDFSLAQR